MSAAYNLLDVEEFIKKFFKEHDEGMRTLHRVYFKNDNQISLRALIEELTEELRTGCVTFFNKENYVLEELDAYLFYIANAYCKKIAIPIVKKHTEYLCPGCLYLGKNTLLSFGNGFFRCEDCEQELESVTIPAKRRLFECFYKHNKNGYHCPDCDRFLPHPLNNSSSISCPYLDCSFVGTTLDMRKMHHPTSKSNPEKLILDSDKYSFTKNSIPDPKIDACTQLEITQEYLQRVKVIRDVIETQSNNVPYSGSDFTSKHKQYVYQAISNLLDEFPIEMSSYLLSLTPNHFGFQHKIFQEYVRLLEESLPFIVSKNKKSVKISSLLDNNLNIFDGISVFEGIVNEKMVIKNSTTEFYIGGRKGTVAKPFFIGKLLSITDTKTKESLLKSVTEYSFSKISLQNVKPGTSVTVSHLRIPPHHQMGSMVYVNRIKKKITDRAKAILL